MAESAFQNDSFQHTAFQQDGFHSVNAAFQKCAFQHGAFQAEECDAATPTTGGPPRRINLYHPPEQIRIITSRGAAVAKSTLRAGIISIRLLSGLSESRSTATAGLTLDYSARQHEDAETIAAWMFSA